MITAASRFPIRTCRTLHSCARCAGDISVGQIYYDGGHCNRWHVHCVETGHDIATWPHRKIPFVYVAGPFSAEDRDGVEINIRAAENVALGVAERGAMPVCPHTNTRHLLFEKIQPYTFWIETTMSLLEVCDAVMLVPGWAASSGATGERDRALQLGMAVFETYQQLEAWMRRRGGK